MRSVFLFFFNYWENLIYSGYTLKELKKKKISKGFISHANAIFCGFCFSFVSEFLYKGKCCRYSLLVDAFQMSNHNICLYKEVDKKDTGCNLKTTELLDCVLQ